MQWWTIGMALLGIPGLLLFGLPAHRAYKQAKEALERDPTLRGGWTVENTWWVLTVAALIGTAIAATYLVWLVGRIQA